MISYRFVPISSQKGVLFFETPGRFTSLKTHFDNLPMVICSNILEY